MDWLKNFIDSGWAYFTSLGISAGSILTLLIAFIRISLKKIDESKITEQIIEAVANKAKDDSIKEKEEIIKHLDSRLDKLEKQTYKKISDNEEERKKEIEDKTILLTELINSAQSQICVEDELKEDSTEE